MKKPKLTKEELSRIRSAAGKRGADVLRKSGNYHGGRPKGAINKTPSGIDNETRSIMVRETAHSVFQRCANAAGRSLVDFMSLVAEAVKQKNPQLFLRDNIQL